jgi:hypothetical protein
MVGLEPTTYHLRNGCYYQLSYIGVNTFTGRIISHRLAEVNKAPSESPETVWSAYHFTRWLIRNGASSMSEDGMKICPKCKRTLALELFHKDKNQKDGRNWYCAECKRKIMREWFQSHKDRRRNWDLKKLYGITLEEYQHMVEDQEGHCAICDEEPKEFHVDHDHETGKVRGLLCFKCNSLLGMASDSIDILSRAIQYLDLCG